MIQSLLDLVLLPMVALAVFYAGYRGLAEPDATLAFRFKVGQPALCFVYLLFSILPLGCLNGLAQLGSMDQYAEDTGLWMVFILIESFLWLSNSVLAGCNAVRAQHYDAHGTTNAVGSSRF